MLQDLTGQAKSAKGYSFSLEQGPSGILRFLSVLVKQYKVSPDKNFTGQVSAQGKKPALQACYWYRQSELAPEALCFVCAS